MASSITNCLLTTSAIFVFRHQQLLVDSLHSVAVYFAHISHTTTGTRLKIQRHSVSMPVMLIYFPDFPMLLHINVGTVVTTILLLCLSFTTVLLHSYLSTQHPDITRETAICCNPAIHNFTGDRNNLTNP